MGQCHCHDDINLLLQTTNQVLSRIFVQKQLRYADMDCRQYPDPYVLNSKGNVLASLGRWKGGSSYV